MADNNDIAALQEIQKRGVKINQAIGEAIKNECPAIQTDNDARYPIAIEAFKAINDALAKNPNTDINAEAERIITASCAKSKSSPQR